MSAPRWSYIIKPQPDELLSSWLIRNAAAHGSNAYSFCQFTFTGGRAWYQDIDRSIKPQYLQAISRLTTIEPQQIKNMMLESYEQNLTDNKRAIPPFLLPIGSYHTTRKRHGQQYCPQCLAEKPYYKRQWRLGFYVYCPQHQCKLLDECSFCHAPIVNHKTYPMKLTHCYMCGQSLHSNLRKTQNVSNECIELQNLMFDMLNGVNQTSAINTNEPQSFFAILRIILGLITAIQYAERTYEYLDLNYSATCHGLFEQNRIDDRIEQLTLLALIISNWPNNFIKYINEVGVTQRYFSRIQLPAELAKYVAQLPEGNQQKPRNANKQIFSSIKKYRAKDPNKYRKLRAEIIWQKLGDGDE